MKPQSLFISLFTVLTSVISLQAQPYVGVQGGVGFATQKRETNFTFTFPEPDYGQLTRPLGGVIVGYQFSNSIAMQAEINYVTKGLYYPYQRFDATESSTATASFGYFEIPLFARYTLPNIVRSLDVDVYAGASVGILESIHIKGYADTTGRSGITGRAEFDTQILKGDSQTYDISVGGGLGVRYAVSSSGQIFCTGRYMVGLTDITPSINLSTYNRTLHLNLGYMLTL